MSQSRVQTLLESVRAALLNDPAIGSNAGVDGVVIGTDRTPAFPVRTPYYVVRDDGVRTGSDDVDTLHEVIGLAVDIYQKLAGGRGDESLLLGGGGNKGLLELAAEVEDLLDGGNLGAFAGIVKSGESATEVVAQKTGQNIGRRTVMFAVFVYAVARG